MFKSRDLLVSRRFNSIWILLITLAGFYTGHYKTALGGVGLAALALFITGIMDADKEAKIQVTGTQIAMIFVLAILFGIGWYLGPTIG